MADRQTERYKLYKGNKVVYVGITDRPEDRENEHQKDMNFDTMKKEGPLVSRETAEKWEEHTIKSYKGNHGGKRPKYNNNDSGK